MAVYLFYGFFTASKVGKTGLVPTVDVWGPGGAEVTAANATEVGDGAYSYSHTDAVDGDYLAVFKTGDATVDFQHVPALCVKQVSAYIDAAVTSRAATGAASRWQSLPGRRPEIMPSMQRPVISSTQRPRRCTAVASGQ